MNQHDQAAAGIRPIEDYALISSTNGAGLVHRNGTIEWLCMPRFDSEAMFASLLGERRNGGWWLGAAAPGASSSRRYLQGTAVLETTIETESGRAVVLDFMPRPAPGGTHELVRIVKGLEGQVAMATELRIRFNYGEWCPWVHSDESSIVAVAGPDAVRITAGVEFRNENFASLAAFTVYEGQSVAFVLEWFPSHEEPPVTRDANALLAQTVDWWRKWIRGSLYDGPHREMVERSLITLKSLTYGPTGGIAAAATTSLPEMPGGERNWDYRYCWLRDAVFVLYALKGSGFFEEAGAWRWWLMRAVGGSPDELQIMYGLSGERRLTEIELPWLSGYENSRPVRIGNGAHSQCQLDVYGSVIGTFHGARAAGIADMDVVWPLECAIARHLEALWRQPDSGLWEIRAEPRHFVHSKVMCWLAFDRMIASAETYGLAGPIDRWRSIRDEIHADVCANGFDRESNSFVQSYGSKAVDAALLLMAVIGFLPVHDPRITGTVARIERELLRDGLVYRYLDSESVDGVSGSEGAFLACSFWLCDVYVLAGRRREAETLFEHLLGLANDVGLFAEEYDPHARRQLGNFPQAFSHVGLINTAHSLHRAEGGVWELSDADGGHADAA